MLLELKGIFSPDLNESHTPDDPLCCAVYMCADIGQNGRAGADQFDFTVITPTFLAKHPEIRWGKGYLLVQEFSWKEVERMVSRLVASTSANTWEEAVAKLSCYMNWEFENYQS